MAMSPSPTRLPIRSACAITFVRQYSSRARAAGDNPVDPANRHTAKLFDELGLPEFYTLEGFVQWRGGGGGGAPARRWGRAPPTRGGGGAGISEGGGFF